MQQEPKRPFSLILCSAMIRAAAHLLPAAQKQDWEQEWRAEIWHRWQFLLHSGEWSVTEALRLVRNTFGVVPDALWHFTCQDAVQGRIREWVRSPWTCLGGLASALMILGLITAGLPATRTIFQYSGGQTSGRLLFVWFHSMAGDGDKGLPPDVVPAWRKHSRLLEGVAPFTVRHQRVQAVRGRWLRPLVVTTEASLFRVLLAKPTIGQLPSGVGVVLTDSAWRSLFSRSRNVISARIQIGREWYRVAAVLPPTFQFLTRQPAVYLVEPAVTAAQQMVIARVRPGVSQDRVNRELVAIAEESCAYYFKTELRYAFLDNAAFIPVEMFAVALFAAGLLMFAVSRARIRLLRDVLRRANRRALAKRSAFFLVKTTLALLFVFAAGLEWSRSASAVLFGSRDPAAGPFLLWLYILGAMGVMFWSVADQRARCRVCLRLLCFPVRVGCPGCLLLDWSGTELLCTEGHGVLHVPDLAPSWEESEHWISLDDSWKGLFAETK